MNDAVEAELARLPEEGITSFKLFMAYKGMLGVDDLALIRALEQARKGGALVMVHAENGDAAYFLQQRYLAEGRTAPKYHADTRPPRVEAEATARAIALAELVGTSIYIVHLTCREALDEVVRGRARGVDALAETCTQYLYVTRTTWIARASRAPNMSSRRRRARVRTTRRSGTRWLTAPSSWSPPTIRRGATGGRRSSAATTSPRSRTAPPGSRSAS
jgi:dihydroorotase-like cyclic amidohydrolase